MKKCIEDFTAINLSKCFLKNSNLQLGCYKGVDYTLPNEINDVNGGVLDLDGDSSRSTLVDFELNEVEKRFREMGLPRASSPEEDDDYEVNFESMDLTDISKQEYQTGLEWKMDM